MRECGVFTPHQDRCSFEVDPPAKEHMSLQPRHPYIEVLRQTLAKLESNPFQTPQMADLKDILLSASRCLRLRNNRPALIVLRDNSFMTAIIRFENNKLLFC